MRMDLNRDWQLTYAPLSADASQHVRIGKIDEGWLEAELPCDVHVPLIEAGLISEPLVADNCFGAEWTEERSFWFRRSFRISGSDLEHERIRLVLESLDAEADVWLNGIHLGHHRSAFYPFRREVKPYLAEGDNQLLVRVTSGLEHYSDQDIAITSDSMTVKNDERVGARGDKRRTMVRKAQYVYGWDWGPRVATCGIVGEAWLELEDTLQIESVHAVTSLLEDGQAVVRLSVEVNQFHPFATLDAEVNVELWDGDRLAASAGAGPSLRSGWNRIELQVKLDKPKLWWPNGMGEQPLYTVKASVNANGNRVRHPEFRIGLRTVSLNTDRRTDGNRGFVLEVNGVPVFCKGGNWIPADSIYARVTDERYETLVREAKEANFNMLRIWGGGIYERDVFYEKCDEHGILIWHDFMFACAKYPDHLDWYREEVVQEMEYQTRRLRNHAALALWCGNNENHWGFDEWWGGTLNPDFYGGATIYNDIAPRIVARECPSIPYWNSSPYGGAHPNGDEEGDKHHWGECMMNPEMEKRILPEEYDKVTAKFVSEYGYIGPCRKSTIERYHAGHPLNPDGRIWQLHNNTFEQETVKAGIQYHYRDAAGLTIDDYLLYAGMCQGIMLGYSLEAFRAKPFCSGGLFWMYNDCWGEVGWTIIDYDLRRKLSYYFVRRAFAPRKLILRPGDSGTVTLTAINDSSEAVSMDVEYGAVRLDGSGAELKRTSLTLPQRSRNHTFRFEPGSFNPAESMIIARPVEQDTGFETAILRSSTHRELIQTEPKLMITDMIRHGDSVKLRVTSDAYAHGVHFGLPDDIRLSDEYFDLLPGESRSIVIYDAPAGLENGPLHAFSVGIGCP